MTIHVQALTPPLLPPPPIEEQALAKPGMRRYYQPTRGGMVDGPKGVGCGVQTSTRGREGYRMGAWPWI
ncbi:hypothetical protein J4Q44_G00046120 [Coregonus suidteri]|uniref:Uncharacterized protein n=1 Tax=Coregonus suidteri TaxID=861788 RepID=A0AAN8MJL8_9TELE